MVKLPKQPEINIGTIGHVDHGKTTLVQSLTGIWASRHSEELKRGITIKLGYADTAIYKCIKCDDQECYCTSPKCDKCESETEFQRAISFVDSPGHEILMATMLSGAAVMDGALLVIAADEKCPQPQTREHLAAVDIIGIKKIVIVQNKIDIVSREDSIRNFNEIKKFVKGSVAENAPIIPVSAQHKVNIDALLSAMEKYIQTPERDLSKPPRMYILRSFDVNKPGTQVEDLRGGVIGGSIIQGKFKVGDEVEVKPGLPIREKNKLVMHELFTEIVGLHAGGAAVEEALPGGLVGIGTTLDPSITKSDGLVGSIIGKPGTLPPVLNELTMDVSIFKTIVGSQEMEKVEEISRGETLLFNVGTSKTTGVVSHISKDRLEANLSIPICGERGDRVAISRRISGRWRLIGVGVLSG
ncbi:translation initiation factor IF-2 subunit gamma [Candidatus Bathyarchaeota archaeon]|nr:translation initiation factor IF-2 subunit gamma [Candidatus Bathyarchaeota archaeon]MBS7630556.1 translation initiation factor IF-2 subunit gamma [Candidatus Bathyarchaeota archaeon]